MAKTPKTTAADDEADITVEIIDAVNHDGADLDVGTKLPLSAAAARALIEAGAAKPTRRGAAAEATAT
jgi:hypothetical protein